MFPVTRPPRPKAQRPKEALFDEMTVPEFRSVVCKWKYSPMSKFPSPKKARIGHLLRSSPMLFNQRCYERGWQMAITEMREFFRKKGVPQSIMEILPPEYPGYRMTRIPDEEVMLVEASSGKGAVAFVEGFRRAEAHYIKLLKKTASLAAEVPTGDKPMVKACRPNYFRDKALAKRAQEKKEKEVQ